MFTALYADGKDLTGATQRERLEAGEAIGRWLEQHYPGVVELVPTARTKKQKADLCAKQKAEGREGEVWVQRDCLYQGGKRKGGDILRTKYNQETDVVIMGLSRTTAGGRAFGALEVGVYGADGKLRSLGEVGTGFTVEEQAEIAARYRANPNGVVITVETQGRTEKGQLWAARYKGFHADKSPAECVEA